MRISVVLLCMSLALVGCKKKPPRRAPPKSAEVPTRGEGSDTLMLPQADGTPPKKTTQPLGKADFEKLAKLQYDGFLADVRTVGEKVFEVRQITTGHPRLWAVVTIQPCFDCVPMELDKWKAKEQELKTLNLEKLNGSPGITWEMGQVDLHGQPIIYTYQFGNGAGSASEGGMNYGFTNAYVVYYNDGVNQIRVVGTYKDDPVEDMKAVAPEEDLQALALSFLDVYTHAW